MAGGGVTLRVEGYVLISKTHHVRAAAPPSFEQEAESSDRNSDKVPKM